jgi:hypothetical protein
MKTEHHHDDVENGAQPPPLAQEQRSSIVDPSGKLTTTCSPACTGAHDKAFHGLYPEAANKYRFLAGHLDLRWHRSIHQFTADVMDVASHPGSPQSLVFRIADILSRTLARLRGEYNDTEQDNAELDNKLSLLQNTARYWTNVLVHQRAVDMWEPVLGPEHPITALLVRNLAAMHISRDATSLGDFLHSTEGTEISVLGTPSGAHHSPLPLWTAVKDLFHLSDTLPSRRAVGNMLLPSPDSRHHMAQLQLGRQRSLEALHHQVAAWSGRSPASNRAILPDNELSIDQEICTEIKLYRMVWLVEHRHKQGDCNGAFGLVNQAHKAIMGLDDKSEFILDRFWAKFKALHWTLFPASNGGIGSQDECPPSNQEGASIRNDQNCAAVPVSSFR